MEKKIILKKYVIQFRIRHCSGSLQVSAGGLVRMPKLESSADAAQSRVEICCKAFQCWLKDCQSSGRVGYAVCFGRGLGAITAPLGSASSCRCISKVNCSSVHLVGEFLLLRWFPSALSPGHHE